MRLILVVCGLALAGCGVISPDEHVVNPGAPKLNARVYGPRRANPAVKIPVARPHAKPAVASVAAELDAGQVGVVDAGGNVGVRPATLETSSDATLQDLRWRRWDAAGASGTGRLRVLVCEPTCATGRGRLETATVELSSVRQCGGRSYYDAARVSVRGEQPVVYVRAPC
jgi:hypothetical protein